MATKKLKVGKSSNSSVTSSKKTREKTIGKQKEKNIAAKKVPAKSSKTSFSSKKQTISSHGSRPKAGSRINAKKALYGTRIGQEVAGSHSHLIALMNRELSKLEADFCAAVVEKFLDIIENYELSAEQCVTLLDRDMTGLGSAEEDKFYASIINELFDYARAQHEVDMWNKSDFGLIEALRAAKEAYYAL